MTKEIVQELARRFFGEIVKDRRHLHQNPELSFQEILTAQYISARLTEFGIEHQTGVGGNGIVALVKGKNPDKHVVALRADMDALPIHEANEVPYKSLNEGVMHACGHDVHSASLLGAARILYTLREQFEGTVKCIFQPGEELLPGGASIMIKEGVLENPAPSDIVGQHVHPSLPAGTVGFRPGMFMASTDELYVRVKGRGGHGAMPHEGVDPIVLSAQIIIALQQLVSRIADPVIPTVLTFGKIQSDGGATNIIPAEVYLEGTFRTMDENWRREAHVRMKKIAEQIAEAYGGSCEFDIHHGYPALINEPKLTRRARAAAIEYLGKEHVIDLPPRMTAEDFAYYSQVIPACFYRLGTANPEGGTNSPVHTPTFDIDETALETGAGLMAWIALQELHH